MANEPKKTGPYYAKGDYEVEITGQGFGKSDKNGTPFFRIYYKVLGAVNIVDGTVTPVEKAYERRCEIYLKKKDGTIMPFLPQRFAAIGYTGTNFLKLDPTTPGFVDLKGKHARMSCDHRKGTGRDGKPKIYEDWEVHTSRPGAKQEDSVSGVAAELDALFGNEFAAEVAAQGATAPVETPATNPTPEAPADAQAAGGDNMPF